MSDYDCTSSVNVMLQDLNWDILSSRRQTSRLFLLYKILHNIVDITLPSYITPSARLTRGHDQNFILPQSRIDAYKFNFFPNSIRLIFIYKQGVLLRNSIELYDLFICLTVCRYFAKSENSKSLNNSITDIQNLPEPYNKITKQALETLNDNKLIFTEADIVKICPDIPINPKVINGFGLLQIVEHLGLTGTTKKTFNFVYFSIQEFLAAHYVAHLSPDEELLILKQYFWSALHFFM